MIFLASDHGGLDAKETIKQILTRNHLDYQDLGPKYLIPEDDYPDYILPLAEKVAATHGQGIIACRSGQGAAIAANKVPGIRAAICWDEHSARTARNDDNSNILSLPADFLNPIQIERIVEAWLHTPFSYEARHTRRLAKITDYEEGEKF